MLKFAPNKGKMGFKMPIVSHYELLNLRPKATTAEIKEAFKRVAKLWHPDKSIAWAISGGDKADASEIFQRMTTARDTLITEESRQHYDATFKPMPTTVSEEQFQNKWERLNKQCTAYEQRVANPGNYIAFLKLQISQLQGRQSETTHQLHLLDGHVSQFDKLLQDNVTKMEEQAQMIRALHTSLKQNKQEALNQTQVMQMSHDRLLQENAALKRQLEQAQFQPAASSSAASKPRSSVVSLSQMGTFAVKTLNKLSAEGLTGVLKVTQNYNDKQEWYWVKLKFANEEQAVAFKKKYGTNAKDHWPLQIVLSFKENVLDVTLRNSPEYSAIMNCHDKTGMTIMRELAKYIDIDNTPQYFCTPTSFRPIPDAELSEQFVNKFLSFDISASAAKPHP